MFADEGAAERASWVPGPRDAGPGASAGTSISETRGRDVQEDVVFAVRLPKAPFDDVVQQLLAPLEERGGALDEREHAPRDGHDEQPRPRRERQRRGGVEGRAARVRQDRVDDEELGQKLTELRAQGPLGVGARHDDVDRLGYEFELHVVGLPPRGARRERDGAVDGGRHRFTGGSARVAAAVRPRPDVDIPPTGRSAAAGCHEDIPWRDARGPLRHPA